MCQFNSGPDQRQCPHRARFVVGVPTVGSNGDMALLKVKACERHTVLARARGYVVEPSAGDEGEIR